MSNNPLETAPALSDAEFDAIFKAEQQKITKGDDSEAKRVGREFFKVPEPAPTPALNNAPEETGSSEITSQEETAITEAAATTSEGTSTATSTEAVTDTTVSSKDAASTSNNDQAAPDTAWLEALDPKVKEQVEKILAEKAGLEHKIKSDEGRVAAFQRHYETARRELDAVKRSTKPQATQSAAPAKQNPPNPSNEIPAHIKAVMEYDEASGKALLEEHIARERELAALRQEIASKDDAFSSVNERLEQLHLQQELALLERDKPGCTEVFNHPIWDDFKRLNPGIRALAESSSRYEVMTALDEFEAWINRPEIKAEAERVYGPPQSATHTTPQQNAASTPQVTTDPAKVAQAQKVKQEQERKAATQPVVNSAAQTRPTPKAQPSMEEIMADPVLLRKWHDQQFENELAKVEGRKPKVIK